MTSSFLDFALISAAAWAAGLAVFLGARQVKRSAPRRAADAIFYGSCGVFVVVFGVLAILRHEALNSHAYDLAIYDQVVWNLSQGRWFQTSLEYYFQNFLGDHLSLALVFVAPLYWIYGGAAVLLLLQPLCMALAGVPVYWWAREKLTAGPALGVGLAYLMFTPMVYVIAIDFHDIVLAAPLLSFATYFMLHGDVRRFVLFAVPALLVKEDVGLLVAGLGMYWLLGLKRYRLGPGFTILGIAWAAVAISFVIPSFNPEAKYYYLGRDTSTGLSQEALLVSFLSRPGDAIAQIITPEKVRYILHLLTPTAFVSFLGPGLLALAAPTLGYLLLRGESPQFLLITQYAAPIAVFFFYACVRGIARAGSPARAAGLSAALLVASGASYYVHSPGPLSRNFVSQRYAVSEHAQLAKDVLASIPPQASVVAQSDLVPHLAQRQRVHMFPEVPSYEGVDYVLFDRRGNRYPLASSDDDYERAIAEVMADPRFRKVSERDGVLLLKRTDEAPTPRLATVGDQVRLYGYRLNGPSESPGRLELSLYWEVLSPLAEDFSLFIHVIDQQGRRLGQWDGPPVGPQLPTTRWNKGARLRGDYVVSIPDDAGVGYRLELGLYNWMTLERLPVVDSLGDAGVNSIVVEPVTAAPKGG